MIQNQNSSIITNHKIFFVIFLLVFSITGLFFQLQQVSADEIITGASVGNEVPGASSVDIDSAATAIHLTENTTTAVTVTATVSDNNGCEDIDSVQVKLFKTDTGASAADDDNNHYTVSAVSDGNCTAGGADLTDTFTATVNVNYYADPTDDGSIYADTNWTAEVTPFDESTGTSDTDTIEMSTLTALNVSGSISYGTVGLGEDTGSTDQSVTVTNTGNEGIDIDLDGYGDADGDGYAMVCTAGNVPIADEKYSATASTEYDSKVALSDSATELDMDIPQQTASASTKDTYWGLSMPSEGVRGTCSGVVVFTANSDPNLD